MPTSQSIKFFEEPREGMFVFEAEDLDSETECSWMLKAYHGFPAFESWKSWILTSSRQWTFWLCWKSFGPNEATLTHEQQVHKQACVGVELTNGNEPVVMYVLFDKSILVHPRILRVLPYHSLIWLNVTQNSNTNRYKPWRSLRCRRCSIQHTSWFYCERNRSALVILTAMQGKFDSITFMIWWIRPVCVADMFVDGGFKISVFADISQWPIPCWQVSVIGLQNLMNTVWKFLDMP